MLDASGSGAGLPLTALGLRSVAVPLALTLCSLCISAAPARAGQAEMASSSSAAQLPDAPTPAQQHVFATQQHPQHHPYIDITSNGAPCEDVHDGNPRMVTGDVAQDGTPLQPCPHHRIPQTEERFINGTEPGYLTTKDKAKMAERDLVDPFDAATVVADSGMTVASNPRGRYGAGMTGFGKASGVQLAQDSSAEVTNTFLIPAITHEDPRYHREPHSSKVHRFEHACVQTVWTESDKGKGMPNYSNLLGDAADDELGDFYVPKVRRSALATAERYGTSLGMTPVDNLVTEFTPDIASHIHLKSVFWQNIVDKVAGVASGGTPVAAARRGGSTPQAHRSGHKR